MTSCSASAVSNKQTVTVIRPSKKWSFWKAEDLWAYRELFYFLAWRDIKVRYKQTVLGIAWAVIQPLGTMLAFSIFFGGLAQMPSDGIPYPLFALAALVPWTFFTNTVTMASNSLISDANLLKKIYFPRVILPIANVTSGLVDFFCSLGILFLVALYFHAIPATMLLWLPVWVAFLLMTAVGMSLWLSTLNALFRDIRYTIPFVLQLWMFMSPVAYPLSLVPEKWQLVYGINPMVGVIESFRWICLGNVLAEHIAWSTLALSVSMSFLCFISGACYFRKMEKYFADVI